MATRLDISERDLRFAELSAAGRTIPEIAVALGISISTAYRTGSKPMVRARIAELRAAVLRPIRDSVVSQLPANVAALAAIRDGADETTRNRIAAIVELNAMFLKMEPITEDAPVRARIEAALPDASEQSNDPEADDTEAQ